MNISQLTVGALLAVAIVFPVSAQVSASNSWWSYLSDYEGSPGSTLVDMEPFDVAPIKSLPYVIIAGTRFETTLSSGLPDSKELKRLNSFANKLISSLLEGGPARYVGTFTYRGERVHYVYVQQLDGAREAFTKALSAECSTCEISYRTKHDPDWNTYLKFLYPNQATKDFYHFDATQLRSTQQ